MAQKNFSRMTTKKLQALMTTASDEDKAAIKEVLDARAQSEKQVYNSGEALSPEEEAMYAEAEKNGGKLPKQEAVRMTDEECAALAANLKETAVNHKCQVVPFNTAEWVDGVITGIITDKRNNKVLYAVKLEDGRRVVKVHNSPLIKVLDEVVERAATKRVSAAREKVEKEPWTKEKMEADIAAVAVNVGKIVSYPENGETITGRITSIVPDKRSQRCLYRIQVAAPTEENPNAVKYAHKVTTLSDLAIAEAFDEAGMELNTKYTERRANISTKVQLTPEAKFLKAEEAVKKAEEAYAKAAANLDARKDALALAKAEYDEYLEAQAKAEAESLA